MRRLRTVSVVTFALVLLATTTAHAVQALYTAPVLREGRAFQCLVGNTGAREVTVKIQLVDLDGNVDWESPLVTLPPGRTTGDGLAADSGSAGLYCKFIVQLGNKADLRGSYCIHDAYLICQATGDAR